MCVTRYLTAERPQAYAAAMTATRTAPPVPAAEPVPMPRAEAHIAGVALLDAYLAALQELGYQKRAIDTWVSPSGTHYVRHSYWNGEWALHCSSPGAGTLRVVYSVRATMPSVEQLIGATVPPPF